MYSWLVLGSRQPSIRPVVLNLKQACVKKIVAQTQVCTFPPASSPIRLIYDSHPEFARAGAKVGRGNICAGCPKLPAPSSSRGWLHSPV